MAWACLRLVLVLGSGLEVRGSSVRVPDGVGSGLGTRHVCRRVTAHVIVVVIIINHGATTETGARTTTGCNPRATVVASRRGSRAQLLARRELAWITTQNRDRDVSGDRGSSRRVGPPCNVRSETGKRGFSYVWHADRVCVCCVDTVHTLIHLDSDTYNSVCFPSASGVSRLLRAPPRT